jgi:pyridoxal phosphate enzyme (YggS family)
VSPAVDAAAVADRLAAVRAELDAHGHGAVQVMAVTKTWPVEAVHAAVAAGADAIGENYAQEMVGKLRDVAVPVPRVFIGQLQTNKVRLLAGVVDRVASVDRRSLVAELATRLPGLEVLVQVRVGDEAGKGGCPLDAAPALIDLASASGLRVQGLLTVGPTSGGPAAARPVFRAVRRLADQLHLATCSMGMSDDYLVAVDEGATEIRLGSVLFGPRPRA